MIKIDRHKIAKPKFFHSKGHEHLQQEINEFYGLKKSARAQRKFSIGYFPDEVFDSLLTLFNNKCGYCESSLTISKSNYCRNYDHFRPTNNAQGFDSKEIDFDHYWWLTYEWENLYASCHSCIRFKSNVFPVEGKRAAIKTSYDTIYDKENAYLIDPCTDEPSSFFSFNLKTNEIIPLIENKRSFFSKIKFTDYA